MMTKIYDLAYEVNGDTINLEQDLGCGEVDRITLHPIHLRLLAECTGLLAPGSSTGRDLTIAWLCRQMRILYERINRLDDWLHEHSDHEHADLSYEMTYSFATWELAHEFVQQLPDLQEAGVENTPKNGDVPAVKGPKNGAVKNERQEPSPKAQQGALALGGE
ncbi:MAG: hypothetical protein H0X13_16345 [Ramlibacter sp.]|nr:hypothetical protein [Ramlibacter sp.]